MSPAAASTQFVTVLASDQMRGSKLIGVDVYGSDNAKIGDIDELIFDKDGRIQAVVVGVGGFLGIGTKDVAFPYSRADIRRRARPHRRGAHRRRGDAGESERARNDGQHDDGDDDGGQ